MWKRLRAIANHSITPVVLLVLIVMDLWCISSRHRFGAGTLTSQLLHLPGTRTVLITPRVFSGLICPDQNGSLILLLTHERDARPDLVQKHVDSIALIPDPPRHRGVYAPTFIRQKHIAHGPRQLASPEASRFRKQFYESHVAMGALPSDFSPREESDFIAGLPVVRTTHLPLGYLHNALALSMLLMMLWSLRLNISKLFHSRDPARCSHCGYSTIGLTKGVCPECGNDMGASASMEPRP